MRFALLSVVAICGLLMFSGDAFAQCSSHVCAAPIVVAQPVVAVQQYVAPVVQLQQVVQPAPIVQQQVVQPQVQQVVTPAVPVLQYVAQPVVAVPVVAHHRAAAIVVGHRNAVVAQQFIVGNRVQRLNVIQRQRQPVLQLNFGRRR